MRRHNRLRDPLETATLLQQVFISTNDLGLWRQREWTAVKALVEGDRVEAKRPREFQTESGPGCQKTINN